jgi:3-deoxy-7-phosphoheptulonate synthase
MRKKFKDDVMSTKYLSLKDIFKNKPLLIAGPCVVESQEQIEIIAREISKRGLVFMRGGIFKLRTSPDSFQGLGERGLRYIWRVCRKYNLRSVVEITSSEHLPLYEKYIDIIQVGTRNMFNYWLLKVLSRIEVPILLKRNFSATIPEFLEASKYLTVKNKNVILCLRGIRTFENIKSGFRNTPDLASILELKEKTRLPVIFDPSHSSGKSGYVVPIAKAALSLGADGLLVEVHHKPSKALCDGRQSINFSQLDELITAIRN